MAGSVLVTPTTLPDNRTTPVILMASNASGYQEDHDLATTTAGLTEKQRIVLACVTALLLAVCAIVIGFVLRRLMRKSSSSGVYTVEANFPLWRKRSDANSDDVCALNQQRAASISNAANPTNLKDTQPNQLAWTSTGMTTSDGLVTSSADAIVTSSGDVIVTSTSSGGMTSSQSGHTVITMTMRNNHLIVETEEPIDTPPLSTMPDDQPVEVHQEPAPLAVTSLADVRTRHPYVGTGLSQADSEESDGNSPRHPYMYGGGQSEYGISQGGRTTSATRSHRSATGNKLLINKWQQQVSQDVADYVISVAPPPPAETKSGNTAKAETATKSADDTAKVETATKCDDSAKVETSTKCDDSAQVETATKSSGDSAQVETATKCDDNRKAETATKSEPDVTPTT
ncbi:uncharacterized protein LOC111059741 isoform X2 [Nilaparvata lugens]|uniref:uncharacterized protein LOC111059741 isoform X2 n=1 Tax=Nilaparvata lugens TaxID=108931 RepID=UPI000B97F805|nr:uncharacterized protein LOC111059741 isoform X2 [Nilaparvata lugens]